MIRCRSHRPAQGSGIARGTRSARAGGDVRARFGEGARIFYRLHPPVLRALGMDRKIVLGPWFRPVFRVLAAMRHVRGTWLDPFGAARMRRVERALVVEYEDMIARACLALGPENHALTVELAELPDMVRGYEEIKTAAVARYRAEAAGLLERLGQPLQDAAAAGTPAG
ncbi:DUF6537 domain-containing protein [Streptomyces sp. NPDC047917]|uniref:DUF6537 domain-containing protein n=1 Tax=Streptomyces sp. NPDC047917 TaxID=3365491 RepID=UPI003713C01C